MPILCILYLMNRGFVSLITGPNQILSDPCERFKLVARKGDIRLRILASLFSYTTQQSYG